MAIKIEISPNRLGHLTLKPVSDLVCERVAKTNKYDGAFDVYLQTDVCIDELLRALSPAQRKHIDRGFDVNILMDEETYCRHYVGGQRRINYLD